MEAKITHIEKLLEALSLKTNQPLDNAGFEEMSELLNGISQKYLYQNLHNTAANAKKRNEETITPQLSKLDILAKFIGHNSYRAFAESLDNPISNILIELTGVYHSYVRRNDSEGIIFQSPVRIYKEEQKVWMELKGPQWIYKGEVELQNGCLFVLLKAKGGKMIHHVYKIGTREKPEVLQGIFSGVSTAFDPIGGRVVLIRREEDFTKLKNKELSVVDLKKSKALEEKRLGEYFAEYTDSNLRINKVVTFGLSDLQKSK